MSIATPPGWDASPLQVTSRGGGGGTQYIKKVGMLVENFEIDP